MVVKLSTLKDGDVFKIKKYSKTSYEVVQKQGKHYLCDSSTSNKTFSFRKSIWVYIT